MGEAGRCATLPWCECGTRAFTHTAQNRGEVLHFCCHLCHICWLETMPGVHSVSCSFQRFLQHHAAQYLPFLFRHFSLFAQWTSCSSGGAAQTSQPRILGVPAPSDVRASAAFYQSQPDFEEQYEWTMPQGAAVANFIRSIGPSKITRYNWHVQTGPDKNDTIYIDITHQKKGSDSNVYKKHSLDDCVSLNETGLMALKIKPDRQCYRLIFACTARAVQGYTGADARTNCQPACKFEGEGDCGCIYFFQKHHQCAARLSITRTIKNAHEGVVVVKFLNNHVPQGTIPRPVPLGGLRHGSSCFKTTSPPTHRWQGRETIALMIANHRNTGKNVANNCMFQVIQQAHKEGGEVSRNPRYMPDTCVLSVF